MFFVLQCFGDGSVAQFVVGQPHLATGFLAVNIAWGIGVTMGVYISAGVSGRSTYWCSHGDVIYESQWGSTSGQESVVGRFIGEVMETSSMSHSGYLHLGRSQW